MRYHFIRLKRKCRAFAFVRVVLIHFPCVCIPGAYGTHRMNENGAFNFRPQPSQLFAAFIRFSYSRNGLDAGSFYCGPFLNVYISISIFNTDTHIHSYRVYVKNIVRFLSFFRFYSKWVAKKRKNIFAHKIIIIGYPSSFTEYIQQHFQWNSDLI